MVDTLTPNVKLDLIPPSGLNWSGKMNDNLILLDAIIGSYFAVNQLKGIWANSTVFLVNDAVVDPVSGVVYKCLVANTSPTAPTTFAQNRTSNPTFWGGYTSPARSRGPWLPDTSYTVNDFVVNGSQYAICVESNTSTSSFANDTVSGFWSILIDLSSVGTSVLPVPAGIGDANKFAITTPTGTGYTIESVTQILGLLGATTVGLQLFTAISSAAALTAIGAAPAGIYQDHSATLDTLTSNGVGTFGLLLLKSVVEGDAAIALGLMSAAYLSGGIGANNLLQLDGAAKIPAVDGSQLLNLPTPAAAFSTGDGKITLKAAPDSGWVMLNDGTIGSATSGASNRANADTQALFTLLWGLGNTACPVVGGAGVSAAADWTANKQITLLKSLGRTLGIAGAGSGLTARTLGTTVGEETHLLITAEMPAHTHAGGGTVPSGPADAGGTALAANSSGGSTTPVTGNTGSTGGGGAHNNMQPTTFWNVMLKL